MIVIIDLKQLEAGKRFNDCVQKGCVSVIYEQQDPVEELAALDAHCLEAVEETKQQFIAAMNDDLIRLQRLLTYLELQSKVNSYLAKFRTQSNE